KTAKGSLIICYGFTAGRPISLQFAIEWLGTFCVDAYDEKGPEHPEFSIGGAYRPTSVRVAKRNKEEERFLFLGSGQAAGSAQAAKLDSLILREEKVMASYVLLSHYTHQGIEHVKQSPDRVDALKKIFTQQGAKIKEFYVLLGQYDSLLI